MLHLFLALLVSLCVNFCESTAEFFQGGWKGFTGQVQRKTKLSSDSLYTIFITGKAGLRSIFTIIGFFTPDVFMGIRTFAVWREQTLIGIQ